MFAWLFNWAWSSGGTAQKAPGAEFEAVKIKLRQGKRYKATVTLGWLEASVATNEMIAGKLTNVGFKDVKVAGQDSKRAAEGTWGKPDQTVQEIDSHLSEITEIV